MQKLEDGAEGEWHSQREEAIEEQVGEREFHFEHTASDLPMGHKYTWLEVSWNCRFWSEKWEKGGLEKFQVQIKRIKWEI